MQPVIQGNCLLACLPMCLPVHQPSWLTSEGYIYTSVFLLLYPSRNKTYTWPPVAECTDTQVSTNDTHPNRSILKVIHFQSNVSPAVTYVSSCSAVKYVSSCHICFHLSHMSPAVITYASSWHICFQLSHMSPAVITFVSSCIVHNTNSCMAYGAPAEHAGFAHVPRGEMGRPLCLGAVLRLLPK